MTYLLDTVTIVRHFSTSGAIGKKAQKILKSKSNKLIISVISLMEILYLAEKNRIPLNLSNTLEKINSSSIYGIIDLTPEILKVVEKTKFYELHDRLIISTAIWLNIPILSSDNRFDEVNDLEVIWD